MYKLGNNVKNWKHRYFVAYNKADNYVIRYYEDQTLIKEKGNLSCCGYSVTTFTKDEEKLYGPFGIKLVPSDETKRAWFFRAESNIEQQEWIHIFFNASKKSKVDVNKDMLYELAFQQAFKSTKACYGYFGVCEVIGTEIEMMLQLIKQILMREMLEETIQMYIQKKKLSSIQKPLLIQQVLTMVHQLIQPIVYNNWKKMYDNAEFMRITYEDSIRDSISELIESEAIFANQFDSYITNLISPMIVDLHNRILDKVLQKSYPRIILAFEQAMISFAKLLFKLIQQLPISTSMNIETNQSDNMINMSLLLMQIVQQIEEQIDNMDGYLIHCYQILWQLHTEDLMDIEDILNLSNTNSYTMYLHTLEDIRELIYNACYTFRQLILGNELLTHLDLMDLSLLSDPSRPNSRKISVNQPSSRSVSINTTLTPSITHELSSPKLLDPLQSHEITPEPPITRSIEFIWSKYQELINRLEIESAGCIHHRLSNVLMDSIECYTQEMILAPCQDYIQSLPKQIKAIPKKNLLMINPNCLTERLIRNKIRQYLDHCIERPMDEACQKIANIKSTILSFDEINNNTNTINSNNSNNSAKKSSSILIPIPTSISNT